MKGYSIKRGHETNMKQVMEECFGNVKEEDKMLISTFGALEKIAVWMDA